MQAQSVEISPRQITKQFVYDFSTVSITSQALRPR